MQDIPINLGGFRLMITEAPAMKMREDKNGDLEPVVNKDGEPQYVVALFAKSREGRNGRPGKGEEIRVNLGSNDPGDGFDEGTYVELISAVANTYEMRGEDGKITSAGMWFKAEGLKSVVRSTQIAA